MRQFTAYICARTGFKLCMFDGTLCIFVALCVIPYLMYYNSYSNSFDGGLTAVSGVTCKREKLIFASGSAREGSRGGDMRGGMRSGVTSVPALTLVLFASLPCVKIVDLFGKA